jgi:hypothetical protein
VAPKCARLIVAIAACQVATCLGSVAPASGQDPGERALALRFRPVLHFHPGERWRPLNVDLFLVERFPDGSGHEVCLPAPHGRPCRPVPSSGVLRVHKSAFLDIHGERRGGRDALSPYLSSCGAPVFLRDCDDGRRSAFYYNLTVARGRIYIDYWWFVRFNEYLPDHEGDWEGVTVALVPDANPTVDYVAFSAHGAAYRYPPGVATFSGGTHVRVYVARGSHASYPRPCPRNCRQTGGLPEREFTGGAAWGRNSERACGNRCVLPLPERNSDPSVFGTANADDWNAWPGLWGKRRLGNAKGPRSPAFQRQYQSPWLYVASPRTRFGP